MLETIVDYVRIALYTLLLIIAFFLYEAWQKEHPAPTVSSPLPTEAIPMKGGRPAAPEINAPATLASTTALPGSVAAHQTAQASSAAVQSDLITVKTDVLELKIDSRGGEIVSSKLFNYPESLGSKTPFILLNDEAKTRYLAESGLLSERGPDTQKEQALYRAEKSEYALAPEQNVLEVPLSWTNADGLKVSKRFLFSRGSYEVKVRYELNNQSRAPWSGSLYTQLMRTDHPPAGQGGMVGLATYFGAAIATPQKAFEKITFKEMQEKNLNQVVQGGWAAMMQHYFITAWVPPKDATSTYYSHVSANQLYTIGMLGQPFTVPAKQTAAVEAKLYVGPAIADLLEQTAPGLKLTIDYGWFWFISDLIFWMMQKIYELVGNWGWSIVLVTIVIKLLFYHLSAKSYRSMSMLKKLQPRLEALKERHGSDKQKLTQATLELYRQEKVNPMSGCLPILVQIPVFIALYWVLVESVQLRQAPFILWIQDLSQQDPYYVLPILMGISMFLQQRLSPPAPDPLQAKIMMMMPVVFTVLFANFPAGLMLYWFVNNTLSFMQQWYVMHTLDKETHAKQKASS